MHRTPRILAGCVCGALAAVSALSCGSPSPRTATTTPTAPETPEPRTRLVGARWEEARTIGDAGSRPSDSCLEQPSCGRPYRQAAPIVAANGAGALVALWQRHVAGQYRMMAARGGLREGWSAPVEVPAPPFSLFPRIAMDGQGRAIAAWSAEGSVYTSQGSVEGRWSKPVPLAAGSLPSLAMDDAGRAYLVATRGNGVVALRADARGEWAPAEVLDHEVAFQPATTSIDSDGRVVTVWTRGAHANIWGYGREWTETLISTTRAGEEWSAPTVVGHIEGAWGLDVRSSGGNAVVFSTSTDEGPDRFRNAIWAQHVVGPRWSPPVQLNGPRGSRSMLRSNPRLASWSGGDTLAAWMESVEGTYRPGDERHSIQLRRFSKEAGDWEPMVTVAERDEVGSYQVGLDLATSAAGNAVVAWGSSSGLWASDFVPATGWSAPRRLSAEHGSSPDIAMDDAGNATVVWSDFGDPMTVRAARLVAVREPAP